MVKDRLVVPFTGIDGSWNVFVISGGASCGGAESTVTVEHESGPPITANVPTQLRCGPSAVASSVTENIHDAPAASVPPFKKMLDPPSIKETVPPQALKVLACAESTIMPAGNASSKKISPRETDSGLVIVKVNVVVLPNTTLAGLNDLVILGPSNNVTGDPSPDMNQISKCGKGSNVYFID
jgi:hypothetical protein